MAHDHPGPDDHSHDRRADHDHDHGHTHTHVVDESSESRIAWAALITGGFMMVEVVGGLLAGSLALIADSGHMLSDFASLFLAWLGFRMARRPADTRRTYGFRRFSVLAAFVNGLALFVIAGWIVYEAIMRLNAPHEVLAGTMLWIAAAGLVANVLSFAILHGADRDNLNVRGALLHVAGDLLGSVAAIIAAVFIMAFGWTAADPILSVVVALIILRSAWALVAESSHILLEGAPDHIDIDAISRDLAAHIDGVVNIHHAHAWSLDGRQSMMTLHARITETASGPAITALIKKRLADRHHVGHATIEIEHDACAGADCA
jgi:cobalt-zinc-cadmium efflux system protein